MRIRRFPVEGYAAGRHGRAMRYATPIALALATLAGCAATPRARDVRPAPVVATPPRPAPAPPPLASDWNDWPFTPGDWRYAAASASFDVGGRSTLRMTCDRATRNVVIAGIAAGFVTIRTTTMNRTMTAGTAISLSANDPLLDAIAFSRGRFVVEQTGVAPLVVPPHAEIGRVIEDCRG
jgi:hypothetical protein